MKKIRNYLSLFLLFVPALAFLFFLILFKDNELLSIDSVFPFLPWQFIGVGFFGIIATVGGVLDWRYHRNPLSMKIPKKEREAEAYALGYGGVSMFFLMLFATLSPSPNLWLIPIVIVLIFTVVLISYDEFVFHIKRCGRLENIYHRLLVFGNGLAWLSWFSFIYVK